ncbi:MAG TPA: ferritin-like domain-containing protein [Flavisolibacter sp.]|nr:ferritin-like domain-containing protein [Flavisolibacter sp.]
MEIINRTKEEMSLVDDLAEKALSRRRFFRYAGLFSASAVAVGSLASCRKDNNNNGVDLGSGDVGVLNYAYALEQLEAAFYTQVIASQFSGMTSAEVAVFTDIRDHEIAHREFFKTALSTNAIKSLEVNFSAINFASRDSVMATAKAFEDLGVSAYNGAGRLLSDVNNLLIAGKIVSVEARHAALIRELIAVNSFANAEVVNPSNGLDVSRTPSEVLAIAGAFIKTQINASNLPS